MVTANWHSNDVTVLRNDGLVDPPPQLSNIIVGAISNTGATITWDTNEPADTQVEYGPDPRYGFNSPLQTARTTTHQVTLSGLTPNTLYHYRVKSRDAAGSLAVSGDFTFFTTSGGATATDRVSQRPVLDVDDQRMGTGRARSQQWRHRDR